MIEDWPKAEVKLINTKTEKEFSGWQNLVVKVRNLRSLYHIDSKETISIYGNKFEEQTAFEILTKSTYGTEQMPKNKMIEISVAKLKIYANILANIDTKRKTPLLNKEDVIIKNR